MTRVLVTGGAGFIGSWLCERMVADGARVTALDDLSTGAAENVAALGASGRFRLVEGSVTDRETVEALVAEADLVLHLAACVGVRLVLDEPLRTVETNVHGTELVLRAAAQRGARVLLASSSEVYGKSRKLPFAETDDLSYGESGERRWLYAGSKALGERLALALARSEGLDVVVARFFNTAGPRQSDRFGMVLPSFARQALSGRPITVYGDGRQTRTFVHVRDTVEACVRLLRNDARRGGRDALRGGPGGRIYNVGGTQEVSIGELARRVKAAARSASPIVHIPYREAYGAEVGDPPRRVPSLERLRARTGFEPAIGLEALVADVVAAAAHPAVAAAPHA
jgi:UDP-glucose 4-epimerase